MYDTLLTISIIDGACVVHVKSEIDIANATTLRRYVDEAAADFPSLVLSLVECTYIDSSGLRELITWAKARGSAFGVVVPSQSRIRRIFDLTDLYEIVHVYETLDKALLAIPRKPVTAA